MLWMRTVDDATGLDFEATPQRERLIKDEEAPFDAAGVEDPHLKPPETNSPATAESTQSRRDPITAPSPRLAGA